MVRCLTLATVLRDRGVECEFVSRAADGDIIAKIRDSLFPVSQLPAAKTSPTQPGTVLRPETDQPAEPDASQTIDALGQKHVDWLIVDHYGLDEIWHRKLRPHVGRIMVIDDLANRNQDCDVLLDQNYFKEPLNRYAGLVPPSTNQLLGPKFALLDPVYEAYRLTAPPLRSRDGILVYFGGSDPFNLTAKVVTALTQANLVGAHVDVVVGPSNPHRSDVCRLVNANPDFNLHEPRPHLADLLSRARLSIGAGGGTTWERLALTVPSLVITSALNQEATAVELAECGLIDLLGTADSVSESEIVEAVTRRLADDHDGANLQANLVDGLGAQRVAEVICPSKASRVVVRERRSSDDGLVELMADSVMEYSEVSPTDTYEFTLAVGSLPLGVSSVLVSGGVAEVSLVMDPDLTRAELELEFVDRTRVLVERLARVSRHVPPNERDALQLLWRSAGRPSPEVATYQIAVASARDSWLNEYIREKRYAWMRAGHLVAWGHRLDELPGSDFCLYLGCTEIAKPASLAKHRHNLVVHESDLPHGRGWSPMTWQVLDGSNSIPISLIEADDEVDAGPIYAQGVIELEGTEIVDELRSFQATATFDLIQTFIDTYPDCLANSREQEGVPTYYPRRRPIDSKLDPRLPLGAQLGQLRVADPRRYPAYFEYQGRTFNVTLTPSENQDL